MNSDRTDESNGVLHGTLTGPVRDGQHYDLTMIF